VVHNAARGGHHQDFAFGQSFLDRLHDSQLPFVARRAVGEGPMREETAVSCEGEPL
jgi:hypothetical protein